jgi:hypothetical protein
VTRADANEGELRPAPGHADPHESHVGTGGLLDGGEVGARVEKGGLQEKRLLAALDTTAQCDLARLLRDAALALGDRPERHR